MASLHSLTLALAVLLGAPHFDRIEQAVPAQAESVEVLAGFDTVLLTQINELFGSESLPVANGAALVPGLYVLVSPQQAFVFDTKLADLQGGELPTGPASRESKIGVSAALWVPLRRAWLQTIDEAQSYVLEVPSRVLIGAEASVPGRTLVGLAYAAAETRPGGVPPNLALLVNGGNAGLRTRPFYLLPPGGLRVSAGDNALGLRVTLGANEAFEVNAAHPRFATKRSGNGWTELAKVLAEVKKAYPNKGVLIIDAGQGTVGDVVGVMVAAQRYFDEFVLTDGGVVVWG